MGSSALPTLNDIEEEIISLLVEVGLKKHEARLLMVFFRGIEPTSRELERVTDLRQPEVSIGISDLSKRKWIYISSLLAANKGRPVKIYRLAKPVDNILDEIIEAILDGHDQQILMLRRIREIFKAQGETGKGRQNKNDRGIPGTRTRDMTH
jgi:predicted transcriptional regulator